MRRVILLTTAMCCLVASASASASVTSPCKLINAANASTTLGVSVAASGLQKRGLYESCVYFRGSKGVVVLVRHLSHANFVTSAKKNPGPVVHVSGVGSDAYSVKGPGLLVWQDGTEITLLVSGIPNALTAEKKLGRIATAQL
jgi:hypothetical protein